MSVLLGHPPDAPSSSLTDISQSGLTMEMNGPAAHSPGAVEEEEEEEEEERVCTVTLQKVVWRFAS